MSAPASGNLLVLQGGGPFVANDALDARVLGALVPPAAGGDLCRRRPTPTPADQMATTRKAAAAVHGTTRWRRDAPAVPLTRAFSGGCPAPSSRRNS